MKFITSAAVAAALCATSVLSFAQVPQYGSNVNRDQARKVIAAAVVEATKLNLPMAIAVVDTAGQLVAFERMDNTQTGSIAVAQDKASTSAMFRRPTKAYEDAVAAGGIGLRVLTLKGVSAVDGGLPLTLDGKIIGAIGVSGAAPDKDGQVAKAGADAMAK